MNYLSSILASIDEPTSASATPGARPPVTSRATLPARPNPAMTNGGTLNAQPLKRKAEGELSNNVPAKIVKPSTPAQIGGTARPVVASTSGTSGYRGTARPEFGKSAIRPVQRAQTMSTPTARPSIPKPVPVKAPTAPAPAATPLKKNSYKEIMARGKQNVTTIPSLGVIKHKQTEKLSKKEREKLAQEAAEKAKANAVRDKKLGVGKRPGSSEPAIGKPGEQAKEKRKGPDLGYTGTARPKAISAEPPQYRGTMGLPRPGQVRRPQSAAQKQSASRYPRYAEYSDEELDDEQEEDYESDLSDMEAGIDDVEAEEEEALREAKKADAAEKALENKLKREKLERKNKLTALAAQARKKKPMY
ncbi:hypothetical protein EG328_000417 [Venturia inaequalis]|uniref:Uncharacterized protein n=1 Tax=Venturia inaequalis TaxID=5025 RepID=A0A8H3V3B2_VENIN|nr:hypothetical protein EG328_000417 [Venturia inaequalis]KAE9980286.1 hypothetical protein EG327_006645 [Venturia inaequalis]